MAGAGRDLFGDLRGRAVWIVLGALVCQMGLGFGYVFAPLAPDILEEFGWTRTLWSSARAPQIFAVALASPLVGAATIRFGARGVLGVAALLLGVSFTGMSQMTQLWQLTAWVVVFGLAITGLGDITVGQVVSQWVERGRGLALGLVYTGSNLGGALFVRFAASVAEDQSWRDVLWMMGSGAFIVMFPIAFWVVRAPTAGRSAVEAESPVARAEDEAALDLRGALRTRSFWILAFTLFSFFFYFLGMFDHLVLALVDAGMPREEAAAHFSNAVLLGLASKVALGAAADRIPHHTALLLVYALLAVSSLLLLQVPHAVFLPLFVLSFGFSYAARDVVYPLIVIRCFGLRYMAQIYGALMLALLPGGVLGPIFAGAVHDRTGSYTPAFATFAALNAVSVALLFLLRRETGRRA